jgi:hypothetical protein
MNQHGPMTVISKTTALLRAAGLHFFSSYFIISVSKIYHPEGAGSIFHKLRRGSSNDQ